MAETQFTPGPWSVEDPFDFELTIVEAGKPTSEWRFIAACGLPEGDDDQAFTAREVHANARLIAAAPDMVNALEAVQQRITEAMDLERISPAQALEELAIIVSATLAKALGK